MWADYYEKYRGSPKFGMSEQEKLDKTEQRDMLKQALMMRMLQTKLASNESIAANKLDAKSMTEEQEGFADEASIPKTMGGLPIKSIKSGKGGRLVPEYGAGTNLFGVDTSTTETLEDKALAGEDYLNTKVPAQYHDTVRNIANMKISGKDIGLYKNPTMRTQIDSWAMRYRPEFNPQNVDAFQGLKKDYTVGDPAKAIRALNTSLMHMSTFNDQMNTIHEKNKSIGNLPMINRLVLNAQAAFGKGDLAEVSKTTKVLANEVPKALRGAGVVAEQDIQDWQKEFGAAQSPEQIERGLKSATELLGGQLQSRTGFYRESAKRLGVPEDQQELPTDLALFPETEAALKRSKLQGLIDKLKGTKVAESSDPLGLR